MPLLHIPLPDNDSLWSDFLPAMLYENGFLQVGRSDVVNLQYVRSIRNYKVELRSGVELNASRQDFPAIRSAWLEWKGQFGDE